MYEFTGGGLALGFGCSISLGAVLGAANGVLAYWLPLALAVGLVVGVAASVLATEVEL